MAGRIVLTLNVGSTSLKAARFLDGEQQAVRHRSVAGPGELADALDEAVAQLLGDATPDVVGHRFVHGGPDLQHHVLVDDAVLGQLERAGL